MTTGTTRAPCGAASVTVRSRRTPRGQKPNRAVWQRGKDHRSTAARLIWREEQEETHAETTVERSPREHRHGIACLDSSNQLPRGALSQVGGRCGAFVGSCSCRRHRRALCGLPGLGASGVGAVPGRPISGAQFKPAYGDGSRRQAGEPWVRGAFGWHGRSARSVLTVRAAYDWRWRRPWVDPPFASPRPLIGGSTSSAHRRCVGCRRWAVHPRPTWSRF